MMVSRGRPKAGLIGTSPRRGEQETPLGGDVDDVFWVLPREWGEAGVPGFRGIRKEECKMSENKVVHHKTHYRKLLVWF